MSAGSIPDTRSVPSISRSSHEHVVHLYENDLSLVGRTSRLLHDSLAAGRSVIVVATRDHRGALERKLNPWDLAALVASGRYLSLDAEQTLSQFFMRSEVRRPPLYRSDRRPPAQGSRGFRFLRTPRYHFR